LTCVFVRAGCRYKFPAISVQYTGQVFLNQLQDNKSILDSIYEHSTGKSKSDKKKL
jgi:hypothetical protein